ncbi:MAG: VanZ family protein [Armatimonadetes bacterium]|nr:VanZ family protein [Armatimonadota bacterium]
MRTAVAWWAAVGGWMGFIYLETWTPRPWLAPLGGEDLAAHLAGFAVLGVLLGYAMGSMGVREVTKMVGPAGTLALFVATTSEVGQYWVAGRGVEMADWAANVGGAAVGIAVVAWAVHRRRPHVGHDGKYYQ